jgi:outer membrane protein assembly factor BamB
MSPLRRVLYLLAILTAAGLLVLSDTAPSPRARAQVKDVPPPVPVPPDPPSPAAPKGDAFSLPLDRSARQKLEGAEDYIGEKSWKEAVRLLQAVLDMKEDSFLLLPADPGKNLPERWASTRAEAERVLATLPAAGREFYAVLHEPTALRMLKEARAGNDPQLFIEIVRRFLYTPSGAEALESLGTYYLDRGQADLAALAFQRRLERSGPEKVPPVALFHAVLAFRAAGDKAREQDAWNALGKQLDRGGLKIGGRAYTLDQLREQLPRWSALPSLAGESPLYRGNAARSGRAGGDTPYLEAKRRIPLTELEAGRAWLKQAADKAPANAVPLPGAAPIAFGDKLVYRSHAGVHAYDVRAGKELWHAPSPLALDAVLRDSGKKVQMADWFNGYRSARNVLLENTVTGTLSSDGKRVYAVEDVPLPPHPDLIYQMQNGVPRYFGPFTALVHPDKLHNTLRALNAETGEVEWQAGGTGPDVAADLRGVVFLGPPLPLGNSLFVVAEQKQEVRLLCLRADRGDVQWAQPLGTPRDKLLLDLLRRTQAVHLAYADGVLVCPTGGGAVLGVDPLGRSLLWAHNYRDRPPAAADPNLPQMEYNPDAIQNCWKHCAPVIAEGRVVFTAPDGDAVRCLDLRTGALLWKALRSEEDLYVGAAARGQALVVGKTGCKSLGLGTGAVLWRHATGRPSGLGVLAGKTYYLPLHDGAVVALDLDNPRDSARIDARGAAVGNLLFHAGELWSQTAAELVAFPEMAGHLARVEARVRADGNDPAARLERGKLRLDRGDVAGAVADLRKALELKPGEAEARRKLFDALTQLLQRDFKAGEKYLDEYRELGRVAVPDDAPAAERARLQRERQRNRTRYAALVAQGREQQGRVIDALAAYRELYERTPGGERLSLPDDPGVELRPDLWMQAQVAALVRRATPEAAAELQAHLEREWKALAAADDFDGVERFAAVFGGVPGPAGAPGRAARLRLAEHRAAAPNRRAAAPAELELLALAQDADDPAFAARALYARACLLTRRGLLDDAAAAYRALAKEYPQVALPDGRTGAAVLADLGADKRFLAALDEVRPAWQGRKMQGKEMPNAGLAMSYSPMSGEFLGEAAPSARRWRFLLDLAKWQLRVLDRDTMLESWGVAVPPFNQRQIGYDPDSFRYRILGHLAVFNVGTSIFAVDLIERRVRWTYNLLDEPLGVNRYILFNPDGSFQLYTPDGRMFGKFGLVGPVTRHGVTVITRRGLAALDLADGEVRWQRSDVPSQFDVFGDDEHLYLSEHHTDGTVRGVRAVRAGDGTSVPIPDAGDVLAGKFRPVGRRLLITEAGARDELNLRLYDVHAGKDVWRKTFPKNSLQLDSAVPDAAAVLTPAGALSVFDVRTGQEIKALALRPADVDKVTKATLIADRENYYVALVGPADPKGRAMDFYQGNVFGDLRVAPVNGMFYIFDRGSGELKSASRVLNQQVLLSRLEELPVVLFINMQLRETGPVGSGQQAVYVSALSVDKRTGKRLFSKEMQAVNNELFHTLWVDARAGLIDLIAGTYRVRHQVAAK